MRCALALCLSQSAAASPKSVETSAAVVVEYSEAVDLFNFLDNLADWLPGYTSPVYKTFWEQQFGLGQDDLKALAGYAAFRVRTTRLADSDPAKLDDRIFAVSFDPSADPLSGYFATSSTFDGALERALQNQSPGDQALLRDYYARFLPRAQALVKVRARFVSQTSAVKSELADPKTGELVQGMRGFFGVTPPPAFRANFVWWPDPESTQAKVRGSHILLFSPGDGASGAAAMDWTPIVMHELAHYFSSRQSQEKKQDLARRFLAWCPQAGGLRNPLNAVEEPLAIYWGQYLFEKVVRGQELDPASAWYVQPAADRGPKHIALRFPADKQAPQLGDEILRAAAEACDKR
ncbi:hypothetical protein SAMN05428989_2924 [Pseudoxanthomonas sp. GM95]|nr:hypothetical protein SAMN05428989_2924 [Pseudoxanthomonas sp. GM95]